MGHHVFRLGVNGKVKHSEGTWINLGVSKWAAVFGEGAARGGAHLGGRELGQEVAFGEGRAGLWLSQSVVKQTLEWPSVGGRPTPDLGRKAMRPSVCVIRKDGTKGNGVLLKLKKKRWNNHHMYPKLFPYFTCPASLPVSWDRCLVVVVVFIFVLFCFMMTCSKAKSGSKKTHPLHFEKWGWGSQRVESVFRYHQYLGQSDRSLYCCPPRGREV